MEEKKIQNENYSHTEVYGKWENGRYRSVVVIHNTLTLEECAAMTTRKF